MSGGRVWVVTGASRGIGAAIARVALEEGDSVALIARGAAVIELAQSLGDAAAGFQCDVADPESGR
jgi:3-oxoacyl-[acyl-carrier protein] reductase/carbonyl reductase 4